jgi:hypothetical protein
VAEEDMEEEESPAVGPGMVEVECYHVVDGALDRKPHHRKTSFASQSTEEGAMAVQDMEEVV